VSPLGWYSVAAGSWFLAFGLQGVIVSSLVAMELHGDSRAMALAQMAQQLPGFGLILVGGAVADRVDKRLLLIALYSATALAAVALAGGIAAGLLSLAMVIGYVLSIGLASAFIQPSRDALLSDVGGANMMRAVSILTMTQWGMQAIGNASGILGRSVGVLPLIGLQVVVLAVGVPALFRLPRRAPAPDAPRRALRLGELVDGVREVFRSPVLAPCALLALALGVLFIGPFQVVFPLLVRDFYQGDIADLSILFTAFPVGTIAGSAMILARGGIRRKGQAQLLALAFGSLCLGSLAFGPPFWLAVLAVGLFGFGGAFFVNAGRTLFQERAAPESRGRVLSVYALSFMGGSGMIGAPLAGLLNAQLGSLAACGVCAAAMLVLIAVVTLATDVRKLV
jgi:MFS family permease